MPVHPVPHDQPRHSIERPHRIPVQIQPLRKFDLRHQQEDRYGRPPAPCFGSRRHTQPASVQPSIGYQQARTHSTINKPQAQTAPPFPLARRNPATAQTSPGSGQRDREPEPVVRADQWACVMRANDLRCLGPDECRCVQAVAGFASRTAFSFNRTLVTMQLASFAPDMTRRFAPLSSHVRECGWQGGAGWR